MVQGSWPLALGAARLPAYGLSLGEQCTPSCSHGPVTASPCRLDWVTPDNTVCGTKPAHSCCTFKFDSRFAGVAAAPDKDMSCPADMGQPFPPVCSAHGHHCGRARGAKLQASAIDEGFMHTRNRLCTSSAIHEQACIVCYLTVDDAHGLSVNGSHQCSARWGSSAKSIKETGNLSLRTRTMSQTRSGANGRIHTSSLGMPLQGQDPSVGKG